MAGRATIFMGLWMNLDWEVDHDEVNCKGTQDRMFVTNDQIKFCVEFYLSLDSAHLYSKPLLWRARKFCRVMLEGSVLCFTRLIHWCWGQSCKGERRTEALSSAAWDLFLSVWHAVVCMQVGEMGPTESMMPQSTCPVSLLAFYLLFDSLRFFFKARKYAFSSLQCQ